MDLLIPLSPPTLRKRPASSTASLPPPRRGRLENAGGCAPRRMSGGCAPRVATLCSGIESVIQALENLREPHCHVAACDIDKHCRAVIQHNFEPQALFGDICALKANEMPDHDILVAGFPCQPFSPLGLSGGLVDKHGRGIIILHILRLLQAKKPAIAVLENVAQVTTRHAEFLQAVVGLLQDMQYHVEWRVLDTARFGVPQSRPRCWIVAVQPSALAKPLQWPAPALQQCRTIDELLGPRPSRQVAAAALPSNQLKKDQLATAFAKLAARGIDPLTTTWIVDIDTSARFFQMKDRCCPCLTRARAYNGGFWITTHGRRLGTEAMLRLQHMSPQRLQCPPGVPIKQFDAMIGNAMSVNVVEAVVAMLRRSCPDLFGPPPHDRWSAASSSSSVAVPHDA